MQRPWLIVAPLTPLTADLRVDETALRREIDYVARDYAPTMVSHDWLPQPWREGTRMRASGRLG